MDDSSLLSKKDCEWLLERSSRQSKCRLVSYDVKPLAEHPVGFLGDHFCLTLYCTKEISDVKHETSIKFFIKTTPRVKVHSDYVEEIGAFKKEVLLFNALIPEMQEATSFLEHQWSPMCYISRENMLVLEELSTKNYRLVNGDGMFDLDHCKLAVEAIAKLHAGSIIWEHLKKVAINERFPESVRETAYVDTPGHLRTAWLSSAIEALVYLCEQTPRSSEAKFLPALVRQGIALAGPSTASRNVLSHGDLWSNNFMFCYDESNNEAVNCLLVDFQLARYAPCALDLMSSLHMITTKSVRNEHFSHMVAAYYKCFAEVLKQYGLTTDGIMSLGKLLKDCHKYKQFALAEACLFGISIWLPPEAVGKALGSPTKCLEIISGDRSKVVGKAFAENAFYNTQLTDLMFELLDCRVVE